ncbi:MAG: hypothetical protein MJ193_05310, partial [Clostridia bacterium]|nr:hypothetical protein [Clostridia bacterium]
SWASENPLIASTSSTSATAQIVGNEIGTTRLFVSNSACAYKLEIYVNVVDANSAAANPYIQLTTNVLTLSVSQTWTTITADLVGGTEQDFANFQWQTTDSSVVQLVGQNEQAKLRAVSAGQCYVTVSHPKAAYPAQLLVVCDSATVSECSISVAESIINLKPTDSVKAITATLVNGESLDKYNFKWSLDVYDIVDLSYSANYAQSLDATTKTAAPHNAISSYISLKGLVGNTASVASLFLMATLSQTLSLTTAYIVLFSAFAILTILFVYLVPAR